MKIASIVAAVVAGTIASNSKAVGMGLRDLGDRVSSSFHLATASFENRALDRQEMVIEKEFERQRAVLESLAKRSKTYEERQACFRDFAKLREIQEAESQPLFPNPC